MRTYKFIPNSITAFGLCCGLFVIFKIFLADGEGNLFPFLQSSAILLLIAGLADLADGLVARMLKGESAFGSHFDSLSDAVTFGVAPPLVVLRSFHHIELTPFLKLVLTATAMVYTLCGVLRLVRYNLKTSEKRVKVAFQHRKAYFVGLPIPAGASLIVSACLFIVSPLFERYLLLTESSRAIIMMGVMLFAGYSMVSRWQFPGIKVLRFKIVSFYFVFGIVLFAVLCLYGILDYFPTVFFLISWGYALTSFVIAIFRRLFRTEVVVEEEEEDESPRPDSG